MRALCVVFSLLCGLILPAIAQKEISQEDQIDCLLNKKPYACYKVCQHSKNKEACRIAHDPANAGEIDRKGVAAMPESMMVAPPENIKPAAPEPTSPAKPTAVTDPEPNNTWIALAIALVGAIILGWILTQKRKSGTIPSSSTSRVSTATSSPAPANKRIDLSPSRPPNTIQALSIVTNRAIPNGQAEAWVQQIVKMTCKYGVYEKLMEKTTKIGFAVAGDINFLSPTAVIPTLLLSEHISEGSDISKLTFGDFNDSSSGIRGCVVAHFRYEL